MSTRSNVAIKVRPEDYEKVSEIVGYTFTGKKPYLEIYVHHDGYPEHMSPELNRNFNTYEKALELVLAGDTSGIYDGVTMAYAERGEEYNGVRPWPMTKPECEEEFLYVFENDVWYEYD